MKNAPPKERAEFLQKLRGGGGSSGGSSGSSSNGGGSMSGVGQNNDTKKNKDNR